MLLVDIYKIPVSWSLGFTVAVLAVTMLLSLRIPPPARAGTAYPFKARREPPDDDR
jgi:tellurite resistance protein TerC